MPAAPSSAPPAMESSTGFSATERSARSPLRSPAPGTAGAISTEPRARTTATSDMMDMAIGPAPRSPSSGSSSGGPR